MEKMAKGPIVFASVRLGHRIEWLETHGGENDRTPGHLLHRLLLLFGGQAFLVSIRQQIVTRLRSIGNYGLRHGILIFEPAQRLAGPGNKHPRDCAPDKPDNSAKHSSLDHIYAP